MDAQSGSLVPQGAQMGMGQAQPSRVAGAKSPGSPSTGGSIILPSLRDPSCTGLPPSSPPQHPAKSPAAGAARGPARASGPRAEFQLCENWEKKIS